MAVSQTLSLGRQAGRVDAALKRLQSEQSIPRLWKRDASLWSKDVTVQQTIRKRLGWLTIPRVMAERVHILRECGKQLQEAGIQHALLLGMGGSSLFAEVCRKTFGVAKGALEVTVLDTTDPTAIRNAHSNMNPRKLCVIVSSKSGATSEVLALSKYFYEIFRGACDNPGSHCIAITDAESPLEAQAKAWNFRRTFIHGSDSGADVGGRFSALTYFGLLPATLMGIDLDTLLMRAITSLGICESADPTAGNPAAEIAAVLAALGADGKNKVTLLAPPALSSFGTWLEQLLAESIGKSGKGIVPVFGEPLRELKAYGDDRVFLELGLATEPDAAIERKAEELKKAGFPVVSIHWEDRYDLGAEVVKWEVATALIGHLMDINPFDEPSVKSSKDRTKGLLEEYSSTKKLPEETPFFKDGELGIYGDQPGAEVSSLAQTLDAFFDQRRSHDYVGILSFLPRTKELDEALISLRDRLGSSMGVATLLGFGPRYLHSTGQLFKGGADNGLFIMLTADESKDLDVPEEPYSFGTLKHAQALGDFQVMREQKRRVLRLHLGKAPEQELPKLLTAIAEASSART